MIYTIPKNKKINFNNKLYESDESLSDLFNDDDVFDLNNKMDGLEEIDSLVREEIAKQNLKKVENLLYTLGVENFELTVEKDIILVDVHDHLYLPNKHLNKFSKNLFKFNIVDGNCNFNNNNLTDWSFFPAIIKGNLYANLNNIKNFNNAPVVYGNIYATRLNKKPQYPLTQENYNLFTNNVTENSVYAIPVNRFGTIYSICENNNTCIIEFNDHTKQKFKLNEVEYLGEIENLIF